MGTSNIDDRFNAPAEPVAAPVTKADVLEHMKWSASREVNTKYGPRMVRSALPTPEFYTLWRTDKEALKAEGYNFSKQYEKGQPKLDARGREVWEVVHWQKIDPAVIIAREAAKDASRAVDANVQLALPEGLSFLGYQRGGVAYSLSGYANQIGATLFGDEMGLGKTIQAIGVVNNAPEIVAKEGKYSGLVICPASLKLNWQRELTKWLVKKVPVFVANAKMLPDMQGIVIVNYDVLGRHTELLHSKLWDFVICDECHLLKNPDAARTQHVVGFEARKRDVEKGLDADKPAIKARRKIFLSGTPIPNRIKELWPIIHYLDPATWNNFFTFGRRYCNGNNSGGHWDFTGSSNLDELQDKLRSTIMIRRLKAQVLTDLPPKVRQIIEIPATPEARAAIKAANAEGEAHKAKIAELAAKADAVKGNEEEWKEAIEALNYQMRVAFSELSAVRAATAEAKIPMVIEHLEEVMAEGNKVVVFAHHKTLVNAIEKAFAHTAVKIVGDTPMDQRQQNVDRFQRDPECRMIIGSIGAMGVGHTLTASSHVVMAELDWVPGNVTQAEDRCHRIGQSDSVLVQHLVLEDSLDAYMAKIIIAKQETIGAALDKVHGDRKPVEYVPSNATATIEKKKEPAYDLFAHASAEQQAEAAKKAKRAALVDEGQAMTPAQISAVHASLRLLSALCDGAHAVDGQGFSKMDVELGKDLAANPTLSPAQAALGRKIALKYHRQLPDNLLETMK